ncbi:MAG: helicase-related protein, partial [Pseudomonadota bacterium]|nr:helicase-related protein [Pseudomonadota bacterium]
IGPLAAAIGIEVAVLTGRDKGHARAAARARVASGAAALVIGTHALFQDGVEFHDLALAVIDEQHRFGVHQRMALGDKGAGVDLLVMTATPIPRSLTMTYYGDLDSSRLDQKPPGRKPVKTTTVAIDRIEDVIAAVGRKMASGEKIFWVCPLVEDSETLDLTAADARAAALTEIFGDRVGLIHGRMKGAEKDAAMDTFRNGGVDLLVATTVIEVGVDVPAATVMVIEHAERFGLAQLHQLRGRIGRGDRAAFCLLLHANGLSQTARARLQVMRDTEDGFKIAEEDLRLRGSGEVLGAKQSGLPAFRLVDMAAHEDLLVIARDEARLLLDRDPELKSDQGAKLRALLYLFEREAAIRFLRAG